MEFILQRHSLRPRPRRDFPHFCCKGWRGIVVRTQDGDADEAAGCTYGHWEPFGLGADGWPRLHRVASRSHFAPKYPVLQDGRENTSQFLTLSLAMFFGEAPAGTAALRQAIRAGIELNFFPEGSRS
jgi:hypothetical protein